MKYAINESIYSTAGQTIYTAGQQVNVVGCIIDPNYASGVGIIIQTDKGLDIICASFFKP